MLLILGGFLLLGLLLLQENRNSIRIREELTDALTQLRGELEFRASPFPELFRTLTQISPGAGRIFFRSVLEGLDRLGEELFSAIWQRAARETNLPLTERERRELSRPGAFLGGYALHQQLCALDRCICFFARETEEMQGAYSTRRKLTLSLSAAAGAVLIILIY